MTRINADINPKQLTDQHLLAELRELPRIPNTVKKKKNICDVPDNFCLGQGHVKFFYNKLGFLKDRYLKLHKEAKNRGFSVTYYNDLFNFNFQSNEFNNRIEANDLIKNRIYNRIKNSKQIPRYYGRAINKDYYLKNILKHNE